ncbi:ATP-binding protein (plasmid) [Pseudonocardia sp. DSM 110487]|uniref:ATP-binding protein n=1 Tax=Pseudonocardia sp. DSM 110487 TaxID=2865833 RepID=UPI001C6A0681|nr:ATP-binding protein [Pseudonocardia sp. DSM 110487]QYN41074.1 ATP-binding protein [Pseudonocardia sp. DSM 110487]
MTSQTAAGPQSEPTHLIAPWPYPPPQVPPGPPPGPGRYPGDRRPRRSRRPSTGTDPEIKSYRPRLALRGITGHLTRTGSGTMAWYALAPRPWFMRADHERNGLMSAIGRVLSALPERWLHWRVTWQPYPAAEWARRHDSWAFPLPDAPGGISWSQHLLAEQERALTTPKAVKQVFLGVEIRHGRGRRGSIGDQLAHSSSDLIRKLAGRWLGAELSALDEEIQRIDSVLRSPALGGRPVTADEMLHLLYRSCALGLPPEAVMPAAPHSEWETEDLAGVEQLAHWTAEPYAPTLVVDGAAAGRRHIRHVLIASLGRMDGELNVPAEDLPWMTVPDGLDVPVEWSARMRILPQEQASRSLKYVTDRVYAQQRHYEVDHGLEAPPALARQIDLATVVQDEHDTDNTGLSARCEGWWRLAIPASTEREALETFDYLKQLYHPKIAIERSEAQFGLAREFIPGEPLATTAFRRRMSLRHLAMAVPTATEIIGDDYGPLTFTTRASGRVIPWNAWHDMDTRQVSGLTPIIGGLGSGKTFLLGALAVQAVRSLGAYATLLDPSGPLTRLTELPELRGYARGLSLLDAPAGSLNPYGLVADPDRATYPPGPPGDEAYLHDCDAAQAQRTTLVVSLITQLLPASIRREGAVQQLLLQAVDRVGTGADHELGEVLDALRAAGEDGERLASALGPILSTSGPARLLLGSATQAWASDNDRLLVLSTRGLSLPREGVDQQDWGLDEQLSLPLMHLAAWLAYRRVYELPKAAPKMVGLDELRWLSMTSTGRTLITQFARDNRKYRARVLVAGQLASDVLKLGGGDESGLASLCHDVFVGRTTDEQAQQDALRLLRVPTGQGYEPRLGELSSGFDVVAGLAADAPREFMWRSGDYCEEVRVDLSGAHYASLRRALDTNAARLEDHQ